MHTQKLQRIIGSAAIKQLIDENNLDDADTNDTSVERFGHNIAQQLDQEFQTLPDLDMNFTPRRHNGTTATTAAIDIRGEPRIVEASGEDTTCK